MSIRAKFIPRNAFVLTQQASNSLSQLIHSYHTPLAGGWDSESDKEGVWESDEHHNFWLYLTYESLVYFPISHLMGDNTLKNNVTGLRFSYIPYIILNLRDNLLSAA